jgi:hypothetical protein
MYVLCLKLNFDKINFLLSISYFAPPALIAANLAV